MTVSDLSAGVCSVFGGQTDSRECPSINTGAIHCKNSGVQCTPNHLHTYGVLTHLSLMVCNTHQIFGVLTHLSLKVCITHQIFGVLNTPCH